MRDYFILEINENNTNRKQKWRFIIQLKKGKTKIV